MFNYRPSIYSVESVVSWAHFSEFFQQYHQYSNSFDDNDEHINTYNSFYDFFDYESVNVPREEGDAIEYVVANEAYCFDTTKFAEKFVDAVLIEALKQLQELQKIQNATVCLGSDKVNSSTDHEKQLSTSLFSNFLRTHFDSSDSSFADWPKISEFNIKLGQEKLEQYVSKWERSHDWMFCVEFLGFESEDCSNIFVYEVEWSKPTMSYPIPQATASVFFGLDVFKIIPYCFDRNVDVFYIFECSNVIHKPGRIDFQEKWLQDIIDSKLRFFKSLTFGVPRGHCDPSGLSNRKPSRFSKRKKFSTDSNTFF